MGGRGSEALQFFESKHQSRKMPKELHALETKKIFPSRVILCDSFSALHSSGNFFVLQDSHLMVVNCLVWGRFGGFGIRIPGIQTLKEHHGDVITFSHRIMYIFTNLHDMVVFKVNL